MRKYWFVALVSGATLCTMLEMISAIAATEGSEGHDDLALVELGATAEREISEHVSHVGPTVGIEVEAIENWLAIELGASTNRSQRATNWELELPFKKPFQLSSMIEIEPGLGPAWEPYHTIGRAVEHVGCRSIGRLSLLAH